MPSGNATSANPLLTNPTATGQVPGIISSVLPGAQQLTNSASTMTQNLLNGMPSTSAARKASAVFGVNNGMAPGSDFLKTHLYDTYGTQVDERNQRGFQDLLSLISGLTSPALAERAQQNQSSQFNDSLANNKQEFADNLKQRQDEFNRSNDLALQEFGFNRSRYYNGQKKGGTTLGPIPNDVLGAGQANMSLEHNNALNPGWYN